MSSRALLILHKQEIVGLQLTAVMSFCVNTSGKRLSCSANVPNLQGFTGSMHAAGKQDKLKKSGRKTQQA